MKTETHGLAAIIRRAFAGPNAKVICEAGFGTACYL
jgi:hypothetical protein